MKNKSAQALVKLSHKKQKEKFGKKYGKEMARRVRVRYKKKTIDK